MRAGSSDAVMEEGMKISTKGRYAVRVMLDLAVHNTG